MNVVRGYITVPFSTTELELLNNVRSRFKGLWPNSKLWEEDLKECMPKLVHVSWLRALMNVVSKDRARGKLRKYCIGNFTMDMFIGLLQRRQQTYPKLCWMSIFLKDHTSVSLTRVSLMYVILHNKARILGKVWDSFKSAPHADLCYLSYELQLHITKNLGTHLRTAYACSCHCWKQLRVTGCCPVADLRRHYFFLYDSLSSAADKNRPALLGSTMNSLAFLWSNTYVDAAQWEVVTPDGHGRGVFVMAHMDYLSLKGDGLYFDQDCVPHYRDKCLLSFI
ncbi:hypothetical protein Cgig2_025782 [Carnegiea gigantea]|uniref:Uncharacterized protein n=1 Tax=Carnegiea gigantea TaxID=171969 RepID=A0A9Q1JMJ2_9CARY|nr:hypothetical protein Cgig2_025782 [Carnegiea gigantea]